MEKYLINPNQRLSKINKDIYGNFSEHLGRCVYEGLFGRQGFACAECQRYALRRCERP